MCFGAFIGCLAAEMLMQKSFRVWKKILPALIIAIVVICAFITACELDLFGIERYVPEVSEVEKVTIDDTEVSMPENIEAVTALHGSIIANKERYDAREIDWTDFDWSGVSSHYFRIGYCLKNGREVERCYTIYFTEEEWNTPDTDANVLENVLNSREAIYNRKKTSIPVTEEYITSATVSRSSLDDYSDVKLTPAEGAELYACIVRDMDECTIGRMWIFCGDEYDKTVYQSTINIELRKGNGINDDSEWDNFWTTPTKNSVHTNEFLEHHGIELYTWSELNQNAVIENDSVYYG